MNPRDVVKKFYDTDLANDQYVVPTYFHKDCVLNWNSSHGFMLLRYDDIIKFFDGVRKSYNSLRFQFSHMLEDGQFVTSRHTLFAHTIENPEEEVTLAHFIAIWEVKEDKLYSCHEISQQADENT